MVIRKVPGAGYRVYSEKGRNMGTYRYRSQAETRLQQIEMFKRIGKMNRRSR